MKEKDKIYNLYNKIQYYNNLIQVKDDSKRKYEEMVDTKSKEIRNLQELIYEKEAMQDKYVPNQTEILSKL
jgi:hypothetical protein